MSLAANTQAERDIHFLERPHPTIPSAFCCSHNCRDPFTLTNPLLKWMAICTGFPQCGATTSCINSEGTSPPRTCSSVESKQPQHGAHACCDLPRYRLYFVRESGLSLASKLRKGFQRQVPLVCATLSSLLKELNFFLMGQLCCHLGATQKCFVRGWTFADNIFFFDRWRFGA